MPKAEKASLCKLAVTAIKKNAGRRVLNVGLDVARAL
jgi:hypothetical protein